MSFLFTLEEDRLAEQLPGIFENYEKHIKKAEPLFELDGVRLELIARTLPQHQTFYAQRAAEMKQVMKWLENYRAKLEARFTRNYSQGQRALAAREATTFINGEKDIVELNQLIIEAALLYSQLNEIVEGFRQMGWMVGNITKLRVAELQEAVL
jgi:hypothetical protein